MRIRRRRSDLADPHQAVLLPELHDGTADADEDAPRARFRWNPDSHLVLRVLDPARRPARRHGHPDGGPLVKVTYLVLIGVRDGRHRALRDHPGQRAGPPTTT